MSNDVLQFLWKLDTEDPATLEPLKKLEAMPLQTGFTQAHNRERLRDGLAEFERTGRLPVFETPGLAKADDDRRSGGWRSYVRERLSAGRTVESLSEGLSAADAAEVAKIAREK